MLCVVRLKEEDSGENSISPLSRSPALERFPLISQPAAAAAGSLSFLAVILFGRVFQDSLSHTALVWLVGWLRGKSQEDEKIIAETDQDSAGGMLRYRQQHILRREREEQ